MSKKILAVVLALVMVFSVMLPMTIATAATGNWGEITYQIIDGKLYITAITDASYNRLGLFYADDTAVSACIETTNSYVEDGDNRVWTLKIDAPYEPTEFVIRGRSAETNTYKAGGISDAFEVTPEYPFYYVEPVAIAGKVTITVKSTSPYVDRVAIVDPNTNKVVGFDANPDAGEDYEGETVWKISFPYDENVNTYIVRARDTRTGIYDRKAVAETEIPFHEVPIVDVDITDYDEENILVKVTTIPDIARVKVAFADDATGHIAYARNYSYETEDYTWVWEMIIAKPEVTTEYAIDCALTGVVYSRYFSYETYEVEEEEEVIPPAPEFFVENTANAITNGWYTTTDGLVQIYVGDWVYYGAYGLTLVASYTAPVDAVAINVYAADPDDVFAAKTAEDFAIVLGETVNEFTAVTIAGEYAGFVAKTATYTNLVFQANGSKYFINYINADDGIAIDAVAERAFNNIVVCKPAPDAEANANAVVDGWYTTTDGLVQMYVKDWIYYGSYGLTLVAPRLAPVDAATIAVYPADADDVFAAKTAEDFAAVLGETVNEFTAVTIAGQYPGYIAKTATYLNLVFQANGYKYFINYINADDGIAIDNAFQAVVNSIIVYEPAECTHENTTTVTVDATCTEAGSITVTCDDCGEVVSTEEIPATGEHTYAWEITVMPAVGTAGEKTFTCGVCGNSYTEAIAALTAPNAEAAANAVDNGWYMTTDGLVQLYVADWSYYGAYGLTLVKNPLAYPTSAVAVAVYAADSDEVFAAKTADDFATVLGEAVNSFEAVTVAGQYPGYIAKTATMRNLVFQANGAKYFINVIIAAGETDICEELFAIMAANVIVNEPKVCEHEYTWEITTMPAIDVAGEKTFTCGACGDAYTEAIAALTAPISAEPNTIAGTWYTTTDGLVQLYFADWSYYGAYGLTLVKANTIPTSAAAIAVYDADSDEVFAAKTAEDFATVLGETVDSFEAVTVAGQYPGYVAKTATMRNLVFQANGFKYFINILVIEGEFEVCDELFAIMAANVIVNEPAVCEHENTTVVETVAGTYNTKGTGNVVCDDCGEVVEAGVETTYVAPAAELYNTVTADGWYITTDGKVAMNVGSWIYYGSYGLTLVASNTIPVDAAAIAVYVADSDEVFAAKTAEDFGTVLGETVNSFEAVTVAGQYPGYVAITANMMNLVFQANGYKYFINFINADDGIAIDDVFATAKDSIIVY